MRGTAAVTVRIAAARPRTRAARAAGAFRGADLINRGDAKHAEQNGRQARGRERNGTPGTARKAGIDAGKACAGQRYQHYLCWGLSMLVL